MEQQHIHEDIPGGVPLKMWTRGVPVEDEARRQLQNAARLPIVHHHIAAMARLAPMRHHIACTCSTNGFF